MVAGPVASLEHYAAEVALEAAAALHGVEPALMKGLAWIESHWNTHAVSPVGARGLCQIMPATGDDLGLQHPFDAMQNAIAAASYLRSLLNHYHGDLWLALAAYNWGRGHVDRARMEAGGGIPSVPASVAAYCTNVLEQRERFAKLPTKIVVLSPRKAAP